MVGHRNARRSVDSLTPRSLATERRVCSPEASRARAWSRWSGVSFTGRPRRLPRRRAADMPALVRSTMMERSNSDSAAIMWKTSRPPARYAVIFKHLVAARAFERGPLQV